MQVRSGEDLIPYIAFSFSSSFLCSHPSYLSDVQQRCSSLLCQKGFGPSVSQKTSELFGEDSHLLFIGSRFSTEYYRNLIIPLLPQSSLSINLLHKIGVLSISVADSNRTVLLYCIKQEKIRSHCFFELHWWFWFSLNPLKKLCKQSSRLLPLSRQAFGLVLRRSLPFSMHSPGICTYCMLNSNLKTNKLDILASNIWLSVRKLVPTHPPLDICSFPLSLLSLFGDKTVSCLHELQMAVFSTAVFLSSLGVRTCCFCTCFPVTTLSVVKEISKRLQFPK